MDDLKVKSVKAFLRTAYDAQQKIEADKALLEQAREQAESAQGIRYDKINVSSGGYETPALERAALNIVQLESDLAADIERWTAAVRAVRDVISAVGDTCLRAVLEHRYLRMMSWEQIAVDIGYSWRHLHRLHGKALAEARKVLQGKGIMA